MDWVDYIKSNTVLILNQNFFATLKNINNWNNIAMHIIELII